MIEKVSQYTEGKVQGKVRSARQKIDGDLASSVLMELGEEMGSFSFFCIFHDVVLRVILPLNRGRPTAWGDGRFASTSGCR